MPGLTLKMTARDWRAGELHLLLAALVVSVAALSAVGFFADRIRNGMQRDARQALAADLLVSSDAPLDPALRADAAARGLRAAATTSMVSMATAGQGDEARSQLVSLKGVSDGYPLRGALAFAPASAPAAAAEPPAPGTAWIDPALASRLALHSGGKLRVGDAEFAVARVIAVEPDRRFSPVNLSPRVMLAERDLPATGLLAPGVRATYGLLLAGEPAAVEAFRAALQARLAAADSSNVRIQTVKDSSAALGQTLDRASAFLSLVSLLTAMLAAAAIAMAARRYMLRHIDACAMLRCLGLRQSQVLRLYLTEFLVLGLAGSAAGVLAGYAGHLLLLAWLEPLLPAGLPAAGWAPALQSLAAGLILLAGFALPPLLQLRDVPHAQLLRRERHAPRGATLAACALGAIMFCGLMLWITGDAALGAVSAAGFLLAALLFAAAAWLALKALGRLRGAFGNPAWRFAVTALQRRPGASVAQTVALAIGLTAPLLLTVVRGDLLDAWQAATPANAPNHFIVNVQPDQVQDVASRLQHYGSPALHPSIRARLLAVNGKPVRGKDNKEALGHADVDLSTAAALPAADTVIAGRWFDPTSNKAEASPDEGIAQAFGIQPGDSLSFDAGGLPLQTVVSSVRSTDRRARAPSFEFMLNSVAAQGLPRTYGAAFHVSDNDRKVADRLAQDFPNVTVFDFGFLVRQMQAALAQVSVAVEFLFLFTLASGLLVLYAALAGSQDERKRQAALLRALGATRSQLARAQWMEHLLTGALAGLLAAACATLCSWALARFVFELPWRWPLLLWAAGLAAGSASAVAGGWLGLRNVLNQPPLLTLRQA
ncbi:ABC transporter permease [Massilia sp. Root351]|uniref:ABC transporter permease n=1 Tax=Massilia sp. Root351 TaxID=1736522 RepID=UPI00070EDEA6|nr:FtsX-like permease family protein [Massilia sp. Root351]KQV78528.1 ABC transporter permease [Massilia sp. Root351]